MCVCVRPVDDQTEGKGNEQTSSKCSTGENAANPGEQNKSVIEEANQMTQVLQPQ